MLGDHGVGFGDYYKSSYHAKNHYKRPALFAVASAALLDAFPEIGAGMAAAEGSVTTPFDAYVEKRERVCVGGGGGEGGDVCNSERGKREGERDTPDTHTSCCTLFYLVLPCCTLLYTVKSIVSFICVGTHGVLIEILTPYSFSSCFTFCQVRDDGASSRVPPPSAA